MSPKTSNKKVEGTVPCTWLTFDYPCRFDNGKLRLPSHLYTYTSRLQCYFVQSNSACQGFSGFYSSPSTAVQDIRWYRYLHEKIEHKFSNICRIFSHCIRSGDLQQYVNGAHFEVRFIGWQTIQLLFLSKM